MLPKVLPKFNNGHTFHNYLSMIILTYLTLVWDLYTGNSKLNRRSGTWVCWLEHDSVHRFLHGQLMIINVCVQEKASTQNISTNIY